MNEVKYKVFSFYSKTDIPSCCNCGFDNINALCLDHINGDGNIHRKKSNLKGINLYKTLYKNNFKCKYDLQVLCANCNMIKFFKNKESYHIKTPEWKDNISKSLKGKPKPKGLLASNIKKVEQYTLKGELIKIWDYIKEAEQFYNNNKNAKNIVACCNNKQKTAYGFKWKHNKEE